MISNIPIKNLFYMLAYVFDDLKLDANKNSSIEEFENISELYAEIIYLSFSRILKQGIYKEYITIYEDSAVIRGKLNLNQTIKRNLLLKNKVHIEYDDLSENNLLNQIVKSTLLKMLNSGKIKLEQKNKIRSILIYLGAVEEIDLSSINWNNIQWNGQNIFYRLPIQISRYYHEQMILSNLDNQKDGASNNKELSRIFESFVKRVFERETNYNVSSPHIKWDEDNEFMDQLPRMKTDIVLKEKHKTIIIDTKYYESNVSSTEKHHSGNLYQMFSYIKNFPQDENLAGLLLYAQTRSDNLTDRIYTIQGHPLGVVTINLNQNFLDIKNDLLNLAFQTFEII